MTVPLSVGRYHKEEESKKIYSLISIFFSPRLLFFGCSLPEELLLLLLLHLPLGNGCGLGYPHLHCYVPHCYYWFAFEASEPLATPAFITAERTEYINRALIAISINIFQFYRAGNICVRPMNATFFSSFYL
jgi:hypothetical protein